MPTFANTIDNNEILAKRSQCDYAGNDLQTTYATKSELPSVSQLVPTSTSADADKVLTVDSQGIPGWAAVSASDVFVAKYNTTTWTDVSTAYADGKVIFLEVTDASIPYPYRLNSTAQIPLAAIRTGSVGACAVFIGSSLGTTTGTGENTSWPVYILGSNNTWTTQTRLAYPSFTSSDYNKVLTVVNNGSNFPVLQWSATQSGGVTDVEVNGTSVVNASGVAEVTVPAQVNADWNSSSGASEILNKPTIPSGAQLVPAATSADADKVLTVDSLGVPGWAIVPSQSTGLFQAEYGTTTYAAIVQAINDKKIVYCRLNSGASRMAFLAYIGSSNVEFQYYRSLSSHSASNMTDEVYVYTVSSSGWTTTTRKTGVKVVAGTHMSQSYSNDTLTLNCTWPDVDQTYDASSANAQSGVAVASAIAGVNAVPASTSSDADKVLTVDAQGTPGWAPVSLGDVNNVLQVNALPATTDPSTLYLIPET